MKIGLFTDSYKPYISGVTTSVLMLKEGLESLGHEVYVVCMELTKNQKETYQELDPHVIRIKGMQIRLKGLKDFLITFNTKKNLKRILDHHFDIIHIHTEFSIGFLGLRYAKYTNTPYVYTSHTLLEGYFHFISKILAKTAKKELMWGMKKLQKKYIYNASYTIVPTKKIKDVLLGYKLIGVYKIIPTGIDLSLFDSNNVDNNKVLELRKKYNLKDEFCFMYLGRVSKEKSIELLLEAYFKANLENTKFIIVGSGNAIEDLKKMVVDNNMNDKVIFTGLIPWEEVKYYYSFSDAFLTASLSETQGLTYIEALASKKVVIARNDSVLDELITNEYNGLLYNNVDELICYMRRIINDINLKKTLEENAIISVEKYSKECYTNNVINLYNNIIKKED